MTARRFVLLIMLPACILTAWAIAEVGKGLARQAHEARRAAIAAAMHEEREEVEDTEYQSGTGCER